MRCAECGFRNELMLDVGYQMAVKPNVGRRPNDARSANDGEAQSHPKDNDAHSANDGEAQ